MSRGRHARLAVLLALGACGGRDEVVATHDAAPDAPIGGTPDLTVSASRLAADLALQDVQIDPLACELDPDEACIDAPGARRLLRFSVETVNRGDGDLVLGQPYNDDAYTYSACHGHFHLRGYARYELVDDDGATVAVGRKQAFCVQDSRPVLEGASETRRYSCVHQGLQRGWSDVYDARLACQGLDVTDVPPGRYMLRVSLDVDGRIAELDETNNVAEVAIDLADPDLATPTEPCAIDDASADNPSRECGWELAATFPCDPGVHYRLGCADACTGLGACTGDPMLRVCAADVAGGCSYAAQLAPGPDQQDACGSVCPRARDVACPESGALDAYVSAQQLGEAYGCELAIEPL